MKLDSIDISRLDVPTCEVDLRRDIHVFVDYVRNRQVKRSHRGNMLSKADQRRLAKLLSDPLAAQQIEQDDSSVWVDYIDDLVLELGFVTYDTEGEYEGYTSQEPIFPDNYIQFDKKAYQKFIDLSPAKQESSLLTQLLSGRPGGNSEFFSRSRLGLLDKFNTFGSALGVLPLLDFVKARHFLLKVLAECPPGQWFSTASLIEHLKQHHRYFLIPEKLSFKDRYGAKWGRYENFREGTEPYDRGSPIPDKAADAFQRVEGRYIERFLEDVPWTLKYVDVAFGKHPKQQVYPSLGVLQGFRVSVFLGRALREQIALPRVTVTPSFDVYIQPETYPARALAQLAPLCEMVKEATSFELKITKQKVAAARAADPRLDVVALLQQLSGNELPSNVLRELSAWSEHGEKFVLYRGYSILEADKTLTAGAAFTVETPQPGVYLVRSPAKLFNELERQELMPLRVKHSAEKLTPLPKGVRTRFAKQTAAAKKPPKSKTKVTLTRVTRVQLAFPDQPFFDDLIRLLAETKCPVEADRKKLLLSYSKSNESLVNDAIRALKSQYQVKIQDVG